jgi:large subunit ribosomal protein L32
LGLVCGALRVRPPASDLHRCAVNAAHRRFPFYLRSISVGALPKKRVSNRRQGNRRAHHKIKIPQLRICPQCRQARLSHHVCPNCGTYRGRQVIEVKSKRAAE